MIFPQVIFLVMLGAEKVSWWCGAALRRRNGGSKRGGRISLLSAPAPAGCRRISTCQMAGEWSLHSGCQILAYVRKVKSSGRATIAEGQRWRLVVRTHHAISFTMPLCEGAQRRLGISKTWQVVTTAATNHGGSSTGRQQGIRGVQQAAWKGIHVRGGLFVFRTIRGAVGRLAPRRGSEVFTCSCMMFTVEWIE